MYILVHMCLRRHVFTNFHLKAVASPMILRTDVSESSQLQEIACVSCGEFVSVAWVVMVHQLLGITTEVPTATQRPVASGLSRYTLCKAWRNGRPTRSSHVGGDGRGSWGSLFVFTFFATNARNGFDRFPWSVVLLLSKS